MLYSLLADLVLILHLMFVLYVLFGGLLALKWPRTIGLHLPAVAWGVIVEFSGWLCPLTPLENWLRATGGGQGYEGNFLEHYLLALLYPDRLTRATQMVLGAIVIFLNVAIYGWLWRRRSAPEQ
jgi:hypothetical protein